MQLKLQVRLWRVLGDRNMEERQQYLTEFRDNVADSVVWQCFNCYMHQKTTRKPLKGANVTDTSLALELQR